MISKHLDKDNLHHAYLIEGARDEIVPEILAFCESLKIKTTGNPDFCRITIDNFKIDEAFDLRAMSTDKGFSLGRPGTGEASAKKIFVLCFNTVSLDAQNVLLKMFEEPVLNTHFFVIVPDVNTLLKTLISRFYFIKGASDLPADIKEAEKFIAMPLKNRIDFVKELLTEIEEEDAEGNEIAVLDSTRSKALKFLNALEVVLHGKFVKNFSGDYFYHLFKVREFLRMPGSSAKSLMESVALVVPNF